MLRGIGRVRGAGSSASGGGSLTPNPLVRISAQTVSGLADGTTLTGLANSGSGGTTYDTTNGGVTGPVKQTVSGKPTLQFTETSNNRLLLATTIDAHVSASIFFVGWQTAATRMIAFGGGSVDNGFCGYSAQNGTGVLFRSSSDVGIDMTSLASVAGLKVFGLVIDGSQNVTKYDNSTTGVSVGSISAIGGAFVYRALGFRAAVGGQYSTGYLSEGIYYNSALSPTDAASVVTQLKTLYGIA